VRALHLVALVIEVEQPEGLSARKLVLETAKHNVLTAYNGAEGVELLRRFPGVDVVIAHMLVRDIPFRRVVEMVKEIRPDVRIVALSPDGGGDIADADFVVPSHEPQKLLELLHEKFGASTRN
jgi:hypothetical protein